MSESVVHPLFDPRGLYRLVAQEGLSRDGGKESFVRYFLGLQRRRMREGKGTEGPSGWRFRSQEVNERVEAFHAKVREHRAAERRLTPAPPPEAAPAAAEAPLRIAAACLRLEAEVRTPALVIAYLTDRSSPRSLTPLREKRRGGPFFTRMGEAAAGAAAGPAFEVVVPQLKAGRRCLALLLSDPLLLDLAKVLNRALWNEDEVAALSTLAAVLRPEVLDPADDAGFEVACRVAALLKCAPAYEATVSASGTFEMSVPLKGDCPLVQNGSYVACCVGPMDEDFLEPRGEE